MPFVDFFPLWEACLHLGDSIVFKSPGCGSVHLFLDAGKTAKYVWASFSILEKREQKYHFAK
jgi:hypothetical protein